MTDGTRRELPIDAKLLSEVIIELNISRRSVALYPEEHPIKIESIKRAYNLLNKLFEIRPSITLGISGDTLIVDDYALDRKNPVFREFSLGLHQRGIATVTFYSSMTEDELSLFHELTTSKEMPHGKALVEQALQKGLNHIRITPLEISKFQFVEDRVRTDRCGSTIIEDYIFELLKGGLSEKDEEGLILKTPPEQIATAINNIVTEDSTDDTYERIITAYIKRKGDQRIRNELFNRFVSFTEGLKPELKRQFLKRAFSAGGIATEDLEIILKELTMEDFERFLLVFQEHSTMIPETIRNLINKLYTTRGEAKIIEMMLADRGPIHDIEFDEKTMRLFQDDHFDNYVPEDYISQLSEMLQIHDISNAPATGDIAKSFKDSTIDDIVSGILLELIDLDLLRQEELLKILTRLSEFVEAFVDTGRFDEVANVYNAVYVHSLSGRFREEASSMIEYFFRTGHFINRLVDALMAWGHLNKDGVTRLVRTMRLYLVHPIMDRIVAEDDPSKRKLFLSVLSGMGSDVAEEASKRLDNKRADVIRDMIYLLRKCGGKRYLKEVRRFLDHPDRDVAIEALKTLHDLDEPDFLTHLRRFLKGNDPYLREKAVILIGRYRLKEFVPYLLHQLERKDIFNFQLDLKKAIVHALAEIGDPSAIDALIRVYQSKSLLFGSHLEELKVEIFKGLSRYPLNSIIPLAEVGLRSKNKEIVTISKNIVAKVKKDVRD